MFHFLKREKLIYTYLCRTCDIFYESKKETDNKCPGCGRVGQIVKTRKR